jgi:hypothetical protein
MLDTPVLFIVFNRPDVTRQVFSAIREAQPRRLFVSADAPRPERPGEAEACAATRAVATAVDWDCEVETLFHDHNQGCGLGISGAVSWFLSRVEEGIIFEDDCLPDPSFFPYCEELLERYRNNQRVMMISGDNFLFGKSRGSASYYFSRYSHAWGWATWRSSWRRFEEAADREEIRRRNAYAWQWFRVLRDHHGLSVAPNRNLVANIGCGTADAAHTTTQDPHYADLPTQPMLFPLRHPRWVRGMDRYPDYSILVQEDRTYAGLPANCARRAYHRSRTVAGCLKRSVFGRPRNSR